MNLRYLNKKVNVITERGEKIMWFTKSQNDVLKELNVDPKVGLTTDEVNARLQKYGQNKLKGKPKKTLLQLFIAQLQDMLIYVLIL